MILKKIYNLILNISFFREILAFFIILILKISFIKTIINYIYNKLDYLQKKAFYALFSKALVDKKINIKSSNWEIYFCNKKILMPLRSDNITLDWDLAVSILGHDLDVIKSYEILIKNNLIDCFFDIGTNYGTHSLLFLSQYIKTISFEPNQNCNEYFFESCKINSFTPNMNNIGIGDKEEVAYLKFPKNALWNGSLSKDVTKDFEEDAETLEVNVKTLDSFVFEKTLNPDLIKIDTEGFELNVLNGATKTIENFRPIVIFECNFSTNRKQIFELFDKYNFTVCKLPISSDLTAKKFTCNEFESSNETNFLALDNNGQIKII